jgi:hypothetical protein
MAKPNYQFEKRQRDLAKKNKKEEKLRQKQAAHSAAATADGAAGSEADPVDTETPSGDAPDRLAQP